MPWVQQRRVDNARPRPDWEEGGAVDLVLIRLLASRHRRSNVQFFCSDGSEQYALSRDGPSEFESGCLPLAIAGAFLSHAGQWPPATAPRWPCGPPTLCRVQRGPAVVRALSVHGIFSSGGSTRRKPVKPQGAPVLRCEPRPSSKPRWILGRRAWDRDVTSLSSWRSTPERPMRGERLPAHHAPGGRDLPRCGHPA